MKDIKEWFKERKKIGPVLQLQTTPGYIDRPDSQFLIDIELIKGHDFSKDIDDRHYAENANPKSAEHRISMLGYSYSKLADYDRAYRMQHIRELIRVGVFRMVSALGMGAAFLFIYWLAEYWCIHLPMLRFN